MSIPLMLSKVPLLMHLSAHDKARLPDIMEAEDFAADATIISQGDIERDDDSFMYFMETGEAVATIDGEYVMRYMRGGYFGELALLNKAPRKATVCAGSSGARCLKLSRLSFQKLEFNEAMLQEQQDLYDRITDKLSVKQNKKTTTQQKLDDQHHSLADRHFGTLRGMGAGMLKILGSDAASGGGEAGGGVGKLRSLSDVVGAEQAGLNTPVFVTALTQNKHDDNTVLRVRGRVLAAINAGQRPNLTPTSNRDAVSGIWTLYYYYHTTIMRGAARTRDGEKSEQSDRGKATLPSAFQMKVALAAGLPRTLDALLGLFAPERAWKDSFDFRVLSLIQLQQQRAERTAADFCASNSAREQPL
jgi:CRP-like cAMP-binding protein